MAEAFAVISIVASIGQLVDLTAKVVHRLDEFRSDLGEVPASLKHVHAELPVLQKILQQARVALNNGRSMDEDAASLSSVIQGCEAQIAELDSILVKVIPKKADGRAKRALKALDSVLRQDDKIEGITTRIHASVNLISFYYTASASSLQPLKDAKLIRIRQWLNAPDPTSNYHTALDLRQAGTGSWFLQSRQYLEWKNTAAWIWLHGIPGCGKSILSSTIIEDILNYTQLDRGRVVAYFYFDFNDPRKQDYMLMAHSLLAQLSQQAVRMPAVLETLFASCDNGSREAPIEGLLGALRQLLDEFPETFLIIDALDECSQQDKLMDVFDKIAKWGTIGLRLLVTSRRERVIVDTLERLVSDNNVMGIQGTLVDQDIELYVREKLSKDARLKKWKGHGNAEQDILRELTEGAKGMFRWVACQLDTLQKCRTKRRLYEALKSLPPTLDDTYERILCTISEDDRDCALCILRWVAYASRPMRISELAEAVAITGDPDPAFDRDDVLVDDMEVLDICSSLIRIVEPDSDEAVLPHGQQGTFVVLAHYSVKEYLISSRIQASSAALFALDAQLCHTFIARCCLGYLLQFRTGYEPGVYYALAGYAAQEWIPHTQKGRHESAEMVRVIVQFFSEGGPYRTWTRTYDPEDRWRSDSDVIKHDPPTGLYYSSLAGFYEVVNQLLTDGKTDVNARGGQCDTALQVASKWGHEQIVNLLVSNGADVNARGGLYGNALKAASACGHARIVSLLLDKGADVNARGGFYGNALSAASLSGHARIVSLLLDKGANVNAEGGYYYKHALEAASRGGHEQIVSLLIDKGADVNAPGRLYSNALEAASRGGHEQIVSLLIDKGADVNAPGGLYSNALEAASSNGHEQVVSLLIDKGADVNAPGRRYSNALEAASRGGHEQIVSLLIDKGADVNAPGRLYSNALEAASRGGHEQIVSLLIDKGADVNAPGGRYSNALEAASRGGHEQIVSLLIDKGADVNAPGGRYGNALEGASREGHEQIVKLLINNGADVNAPGRWCSNALEAASRGGHEQIVKLLRERGAV